VEHQCVIGASIPRMDGRPDVVITGEARRIVLATDKGFGAHISRQWTRLNLGQRAGLHKAITSGENMGIIGQAGTGKTLLMVTMALCFAAKLGDVRKIAIASPTHVGASLLGGGTMHALLGLKPADDDKLTLAYYSSANVAISQAAFMQAVADQYNIWSESNPERKLALVLLVVLLVDEVFMSAAPQWAYCDYFLRAVKGKPGIPFGGVQVVATGDCQLPPIVRDDLMAPDAKHRPTLFCTDRAWTRGGFETLVLKEIMRQTNPVFAGQLGLMQVGGGSDVSALVDQINTTWGGRIPAAKLLLCGRARARYVEEDKLIGHKIRSRFVLATRIHGAIGAKREIAASTPDAIEQEVIYGVTTRSQVKVWLWWW
jgi:hypothetical protein